MRRDGSADAVLCEESPSHTVDANVLPVGTDRGFRSGPLAMLFSQVLELRWRLADFYGR